MLLILAVSLTGLSILFSRKNESIDHHTWNNRPDSYMENVVAVIMNENGKPSLKIEAPAMVHYAENDRTHLAKPKVTVFREFPYPWYINADYAEINNGIQQIIFQNHVIIHHPSDASNPLTTMTTDSLTVFPSKQMAKTGDAVTITQPDIIVHAVGMLANLNDGTVKLLSKARGEYAPDS